MSTMYSLQFLHRASLIILLAVYTLPVLAQQEPAGHWDGTIDVPGSPLEIIVDLTNDGERWKGTITIPVQNLKEIPLANLSVKEEKVSFAIPGIPGEPTFNGRLASDGSTLSGDFTQGGGKLTFSLKRLSEADKAINVAATAATSNEIRELIPKMMEEWKVPGLAIAIVRNNELIFSEGFGYRDVENKLPVTPNTLFAIGSSTKAFTAFTIATLVDEGKLEWDKPIKEYLPEFKLKDEFATAKMTVTDLLTHVSGLPRHDAMWYGSSLTREEIFSRLQYLEPSAAFRVEWQYQNHMYLTAGYLAGKLGGSSWEELVRSRIFEPLGMTSSDFSVTEMQKAADHALPYNVDKEKKAPKLIPFRSIDQMGPAGSINSNVVDMSQWVKLQLGDGDWNGRRLISESNLEMLHEPHVVMGMGSKDKDLLFNLYALGWMVQAYRGKRLIHHGGNIDGFSALVSFMPDDGIGLVILTNGNATPLPNMLMLTAYDRLLEFEKKDWSGSLLREVEMVESMLKEQKEKDDLDRVPNTRPSHPIADYAGEYENPAYGLVSVEREKERLSGSYNGMKVDLEHFHYDVFRGKARDGISVFDGIKLQFASSLRGDIDRILLQLEPSVPEVVFTRRAPARLSDTAVLGRYAGNYEITGQTIVFRLEGSRLIGTLKGQPDFELVPYREHEFNVKDLSGFSVRFQLRGDSVDEAVLIQPNGTFVAKRK